MRFIVKVILIKGNNYAKSDARYGNAEELCRVPIRYANRCSRGVVQSANSLCKQMQKGSDIFAN